MEKVKEHLRGLEKRQVILQESIAKLAQIGKDTNTNVGKVHIIFDSLKQEIKLLNKSFKQVESIKIEANFWQ